MKKIDLPFGLSLARKLPMPHKLGILERIYGRALGRNGVAWVDVSNGVCWKLDLRDPNQRWIVYGDYEGPIQMRWLKNWLKNGGVVVDSGANIGQILLYLAPLKGVEVYAFEPLPEASQWLEVCLANYKNWKVTLIKKGLSVGDAQMPIQIDGARSTARMDWYGSLALPAINIEVTSLDNFLVSKNVPRVRLWKLDVEGHELEALKGAERHLVNQCIDALIVEVTTSTYKDVVGYLNNCGYEAHIISKEGGLLPLRRSVDVNENIVAVPGHR